APVHRVSASPTSMEEALARARTQLDAYYDAALGGWGTPQKYPFAAPIEHALFRGELARVTASLRGYRALIDPVAGGMFQYSLDGVWTKPHYEKLLSIQAGAVAVFSAAHRAGAGPDFLGDAQKIARYVLTTLRAADGAFVASQAADVGSIGEPGFMAGAQYYASAQRGRAPDLDTHVYTDLNGMMIAALCELYRADGDPTWLRAAGDALHAVQQRLARGPAFLHAGELTEDFYLSDQVEMARAMDAYALASGDATHHRHANATLDWTLEHLRDADSGGFFSHSATHGIFRDRRVPFEHNAKLAQLLLARGHIDDEPRFTALAEGALHALSSPDRVQNQGRQIGDYALALEQRVGPYVMFSVVGEPNDPATRALLAAAFRAYVPNGIVSVSGPQESRYPYPGHAVIYLCSDDACSSPIRDAAALPAALASFRSVSATQSR
ncbi:MAG TPA: hypothetical protein VI299_26895, partial [Polyangiales bacterium]